MTLKPWREIAQPHRDVLEGTFKQSEFAADISQVAAGRAPDHYQDAEKFFARTYITEGTRLLLISVAQRLAGQGGDPVIQLQTAFGGGKTHTLLAVYHLASRTVPTKRLAGIPPVLDDAGITALPSARVAVIDGVNLAPSQPHRHGSITTNTLWGELAWQLLGDDGYARVAEADSDATSPGKATLARLLEEAGPCIVLMDELVGFVRQLAAGKSYPAGTYDANLSFLQALTEAAKTVPHAMVLASLPESDLEVGGDAGQRTLNALEKYFGRVESVWKPVGSEEAFEIVRRRLFETAGEPAEVDRVCRTFADFYRDHPAEFPEETQTDEYYERLRQAYPVHPEIFDRLYEDWSTLDKFQRTRGVLQYLAIVIHQLWNGDNRDAMIMPGSLPLDDSTVRDKSIHYLPQGWEPVIEREVDGPRSEPYEIDGRETRFGSVQAARRTARTIFLGSAPSSSEQALRGIRGERILLGAAQPGQTVGVFTDVLGRLRDRLQYLYADEGRFWFDTKPNLRREMESRKQRLTDKTELEQLIKDRLRRAFGRAQAFGGIHVFTPSVDIPDDYGTGPKLVVLPPSAPCSAADYQQAAAAAEKILRNRGEQPRQKQNRLLFLAADADVFGRLFNHTRTYLAWKSILDDFEAERLVYDNTQIRQVRQATADTDKALGQVMREAFKWLLAPFEEMDGRRGPKLQWEWVAISPAATNLTETIEGKLREEEWLIFDWAPIHLRNVLERWYFKDGVTEVSAARVWRDFCHYLYLPRLVNDEVFKHAIARGLESEDYFGFASGREGDEYLGFVFGHSAVVDLDESALLIERDTAAEYRERSRPAPEPQTEPGSATAERPSRRAQTQRRSPGVTPPPTPAAVPKKRFYGSKSLDPVRATIDFSTLVEEVVQQFTSRADVDVEISIDIQARSKSGFDESVQRVVRENCSVLGFNAADFEEED